MRQLRRDLSYIELRGPRQVIVKKSSRRSRRFLLSKEETRETAWRHAWGAKAPNGRRGMGARRGAARAENAGRKRTDIRAENAGQRGDESWAWHDGDKAGGGGAARRAVTRRRPGMRQRGGSVSGRGVLGALAHEPSSTWADANVENARLTCYISLKKRTSSSGPRRGVQGRPGGPNPGRKKTSKALGASWGGLGDSRKTLGSSRVRGTRRRRGRRRVRRDRRFCQRCSWGECKKRVANGPGFR